MAWTARAESISRETGALRVVLVFSDGKDEISKTYHVSAADPGWLRRTAVQEIAALEQLEQCAAAWSTGPIDLTEPTQDPASPEAQKADFHATLAKCEYLSRLADAGLIKPDDERLLELKTAVDTGVKAGLLGV